MVEEKIIINLENQGETLKKLFVNNGYNKYFIKLKSISLKNRI
jgi:hypothetical protein